MGAERSLVQRFRVPAGQEPQRLSPGLLPPPGANSKINQGWGYVYTPSYCIDTLPGAHQIYPD